MTRAEGVSVVDDQLARVLRETLFIEVRRRDHVDPATSRIRADRSTHAPVHLASHITRRFHRLTVAHEEPQGEKHHLLLDVH